MIVLKFPIFQAQLQGGLSHLCTYDKSHTYSCGKSSKLVMGVRLLKGENWVKMFSCYSTLPQSQWLTRGTKQNQTESQSRTKIISDKHTIFYCSSLYFWFRWILYNRIATIVCSCCSQQKRSGWSWLKMLLLFATSPQECTGGVLDFCYGLALHRDLTVDSATGQGC